MKRRFRIFRIWIAGKYKYLKRVNRWRRRQLIRDLEVLMPSFVAGVAEKYGDKSFVSIMDEIGRMKAKVAPGDSVTFNSYDKHKYIEDGK